MKYVNLFETFIETQNSESRSVSLSEDEYLNLYHKNCKLHDKNKDIPLFRGVKSRGEFALIDPSKHIRKSIEMENVHVTFMSEMDSWKDFPKYNRSVIGTTEQLTSRGYGDVFEMIPFDNSLIGICPHRDIWTSWGGFGIKGRIRQVFYFLEIINSNKYTWDEIKKDIINYEPDNKGLGDITRFTMELLGSYQNWLDNDRKNWLNGKELLGFNHLNLPEKWDFSKAKETFLNIDGESMVEFLKWLFDPELWGFKYVRYDENYIENMEKIFKEHSNDDLQIWIGDPCLLWHQS